jgi:hypothetical protein
MTSVIVNVAADALGMAASDINSVASNNLPGRRRCMESLLVKWLMNGFGLVTPRLYSSVRRDTENRAKNSGIYAPRVPIRSRQMRGKAAKAGRPATHHEKKNRL